MFLISGLVRNASAQLSSSEIAAQHFRRGLEHAQANEIDAAAKDFEAAYHASPHFAVLYNLGLTYAAMGRAVDAVDAFTHYLSDGRTSIEPKRREEVATNIALNERRIGQVDIDIEPDASEVQIDGRVVVGSRHAIRLVAGSHALSVRAAGYRSHGQALMVEPRQVTSIGVKLVKEPPERVKLALSITCSVPDVALFVDGAAQGNVQGPIIVSGESHRLEFRRAGYTSNIFDWSPLSPPALDCGLKPATFLGTGGVILIVTSSEPGAQLLVDGALTTDLVLPFGAHHLELRKVGFRPWVKDVALFRGKTKRLTATLIPERQYAEEHLRSIRNQRLVGYGLSGAGGALVVTAGVLAAFSSHAYGALRESVGVLDRTPSAAPNYSALQHHVTDQSVRVRTLDILALSSALTGTALLSAGVFTLLTRDDAKRFEFPLSHASVSGVSLEWQQAF